MPHVMVAPSHAGYGQQSGWVVARPGEQQFHNGHTDQQPAGFSPSLPPTNGMPMSIQTLPTAASAAAPDPTAWQLPSMDGSNVPLSTSHLAMESRAGKIGIRGGGKRAPARSLTVEIPQHCQGEGELGWHPALLDMTTIELNDWINKSRMDPDQVKALKSLRRRIKNRKYTQKARERKRTDPNDPGSDGEQIEVRSIGVQCDPMGFMRALGTQTD
jgi:hypothetical protein